MRRGLKNSQNRTKCSDPGDISGQYSGIICATVIQVNLERLHMKRILNGGG